MAGPARNVLFLACTRPAMRMGVPFEAFTLNVFGTLFGGMILGNPLWWVACAPIHLLMRAVADKNPNFFREWQVCRITRWATGDTLWGMESGPSPKAPGGTLYHA